MNHRFSGSWPKILLLINGQKVFGLDQAPLNWHARSYKEVFGVGQGPLTWPARSCKEVFGVGQGPLTWPARSCKEVFGVGQGPLTWHARSTIRCIEKSTNQQYRSRKPGQGDSLHITSCKTINLRYLSGF